MRGKSNIRLIESLTGALFLTASNPTRERRSGVSGLYRAIKWLNDIKCLPLETAGILKILR